MRSERSVMLLVLLAALCGCGGSGSSGFDPAGFEPPLIEQVIAEQRCQRGLDGLLICPSGATVPDPMGGVPGPAPAELRVSVSFERMSIDCNPSAMPGCDVGVAVSTEGLPAGAELRLALRVLPEESWRVGAPLAVEPSSGDTGVAAPVEGQLAGDVSPDDEVQIAVLVFVPPLGDVPAEVAELRETGARYAFVLAPMSVTTPSP